MAGNGVGSVRATQEAEEVEDEEAVAPAAQDRQSRAVAGLRALLLHATPDTLYRAALALYDLPLAYLVVDTAGLDPGDHLGDLQVRERERVGRRVRSVGRREGENEGRS